MRRRSTGRRSSRRRGKRKVSRRITIPRGGIRL